MNRLKDRFSASVHSQWSGLYHNDEGKEWKSGGSVRSRKSLGPEAPGRYMPHNPVQYESPPLSLLSLIVEEGNRTEHTYRH